MAVNTFLEGIDGRYNSWKSVGALCDSPPVNPWNFLRVSSCSEKRPKHPGCMPAVLIGPPTTRSLALLCHLVYSLPQGVALSLSLDTGYLVFYLNAYAPSGGNVPTLTLH